MPLEGVDARPVDVVQPDLAGIVAEDTLGQAAAWSAAEAILARRASWADTPERLRRGDKDDDDDDDDEWEDDDEDLAI